jgi:hypothetical protein
LGSHLASCFCWRVPSRYRLSSSPLAIGMKMSDLPHPTSAAMTTVIKPTMSTAPCQRVRCLNL